MDRKKKNKIKKNKVNSGSVEVPSGPWQEVGTVHTWKAYWQKKKTLSQSAVTISTEKSYFSPVGGRKACVHLIAHWLTLPPVAAVSGISSLYQKHQMDLSPTTINTEFGCIKWLVHFNALLGKKQLFSKIPGRHFSLQSSQTPKQS